MHVSTPGPVQDVPPGTMFDDGIYTSGELWQYWQEAFPRRSVRDMFDFLKYDIDDECAMFTRSLAWQGPQPSLQRVVFFFVWLGFVPMPCNSCTLFWACVSCLRLVVVVFIFFSFSNLFVFFGKRLSEMFHCVLVLLMIVIVITNWAEGSF